MYFCFVYLFIFVSAIYQLRLSLGIKWVYMYLNMSI